MGCLFRRHRLLSIVCLGIALIVLSVDQLHASTVVRLTWDANTEPDLAGYRIRYGTAPSSHTQMIDVGMVTSYAVMDLPAGTTFYFVVAAYDLAGNESQPSNEVSAQPTVVAPLLTIAAADSPDPVAAGGNLTYTLSYSNTGNANATGVVITDTVPANTTFVSATAGGTLASGVVTWSVGNLAAGASGSVQMVVRVASPLANGTSITNSTYSIDSNETSPVSGASVSTAVSSAPILAVSKTDSPDPVAAGGNLTYTLSYSNTGNANATGVVITDTVPANTTFVSATAGGTLASGVVTWSAGNLAAGASGSVQMVVRVASPLANGTSITNSTYSIDSNETSPVSGASVSTAVTSAPILAVSKTDSPDPVAAGGNLTYTLSYSNTGNANATGVVITDTVPANTTFVSATAGGTLASGVVTWSVGNLAAGATGSVQMVVRVASPLANGTSITNSTYSIDSGVVTWSVGNLAAGATGSVQMVVRIKSPLPNKTTITNSAYSIDSNETSAVGGAAVTTTVTSAPGLLIHKKHSPDPVPMGSDLTYTIDYSNTGSADATGVVATDSVPTNTTFVSATSGGSLSGGVVTWNLGTVPVGVSGSVQVVVR